MIEAVNFEHLIGMEGFSETLLRNHFTLYQGYVANTNKLLETLKAMAKEGKFTPEYAELRRRLGWEWNGARLHELYFNNLSKTEHGEPSQDSPLYQAIVKNFGSFEDFKKEFLAIGALRGIGWVILYHDKCTDLLFNQWINEHDVGHPAGARPLLVMDVFEHAYLTDYGLKRADYLEAFWRNINFKKVEERFSR